ncbi:MAG: TIGR00366 family protein [Spirochaetes bacterium]|nr:TIGR00366 family protein [Spirochaetota bacterium]MBU1079404.1 TIGR00366 family protein [Spirochaetota bacterium]
MSDLAAPKRFKVPHTYVILIGVIVLMAALTYILPAGVYDKIKSPSTGKMVVDPASYHVVESTPIKPFDLLLVMEKGLKAASSIVFFIFIVGGAFQIVTATGAVEAGVGRVASKLQGKEKLLIPVLLVLFSILGGTIGMAEEAIVFVPIGIALARALGFDAITGTAMITLGAACGFSSGFMNPFTVGVAQGIAELPIFSGIAFRLVILAAMLAVTTWYLLRYGEMVRRDPLKSHVAELENEEKDKRVDLSALPEFRLRHMFVLLSVVGGLTAIVIGVFKFGWYFSEIGAVFLGVGILGGAFGGLGPSRQAQEFVKGAKGLVFGALVVGVARGILVVMQDGQIIDTIVYGLASAIKTLPKSISVIGMYIVQVVINFFIPSGSGQAAATMPIMTPLADVVGINRQVAVLAFQFGDGFTNSIIPTSAALMGVLSVANIPYEKWVKFIWPLMLIWIGIGAAFLIIANIINYGPF